MPDVTIGVLNIGLFMIRFELVPGKMFMLVAGVVSMFGCSGLMDDVLFGCAKYTLLFTGFAADEMIRFAVDVCCCCGFEVDTFVAAAAGFLLLMSVAAINFSKLFGISFGGLLNFACWLLALAVFWRLESLSASEFSLFL